MLLIIALVLMFITHLIAFFTISRYTQKTQFLINRGIVARQIITLVEAIEFVAPNHWVYTVNAIDIPNVTISLDHHPKYPVQVLQLDIWDILLKIHEIPLSARTMQISVKFSDNLWLNISAAIMQSSWTFQFILFGFEFIIIVALIFMIWSLNRYNKPLKRFVQSIEKMGRTLNTPPISETDGPLIVREAAKAVNQMQDRIRHLAQERTQMLAAISHDLRTPITRLKLRAQLLEDQEQQHKITEDLDEMEGMINESLAFFRDEQLAVQKSKVDLASLLSSLCIDYKETGSPVTYNGPKKDWAIEANGLALKRAFSNVINNAIKYGQQAKVTLSLKEDHYIISIEDSGPGIPEEEFDKVFKPFYRGEQSRSRATGGIGLGLAVTRSIILAHNGEITLEQLKPAGFKVTITLHKLDHLSQN